MKSISPSPSPSQYGELPYLYWVAYKRVQHVPHAKVFRDALFDLKAQIKMIQSGSVHWTDHQGTTYGEDGRFFGGPKPLPGISFAGAGF